MSKPTIEEILAPKPEARPRIYAYSIADAAHTGLLKVGQTTRDVKQRIAEQLKTAAIKNYRIELDESAERDDGTLMAQNVTSLESSGMMAGGIIVTGTPATGFTMAANSGTNNTSGGSGSGMMMSNIASTMTVSTSGATCSVDSTNIDFTDLTSLQNNFNPNCSTLAPGQMIDVMSSGGMGGGMMGGSTSNTIDASELRLEQQGVYGTVSSINGSTFTLTMDSAFATLTGTTLVTVYTPSNTQVFPSTSTITVGNQLEVRGLMFDDAGTYKMVAAWIVTPTT